MTRVASGSALKKWMKQRHWSPFSQPLTGQPIHRPWCKGEPTVDMIAKYNPQQGAGLEVDLWGTRRDFTLHLTFEAQYELDHDKQDALVPGLSRYTDDDFLDQYYYLFEPLKHYTRRCSAV